MFSMHFDASNTRVPTVHPRLASAAKNCQPGSNFEAALKSYGALDVCAVLGTERRLDVRETTCDTPKGVDGVNNARHRHLPAGRARLTESATS
jgi:hypothetical protein